MTGVLPALRRYRELRQAKSWVRWLEDGLLLLVLLLAVFAWQTRHLPKGEPLPRFEFQDLQGRLWTPADLGGKPTVLYLWAPWCGVCKAQSGNLDRLRKVVGERAQVVSVALSYRDPAEVRAYADKHEVSYPVLLGDEQLLQQLRVQSYPTTYFLAADGQIRRASVGYTTLAGLWLRLFL
jgi:peroxiredoxin